MTALGLMNEPVGLPGASGREQAVSWEEASQATVAALRAAGEARTLTIPGYFYSGVQTWPECHPQAWIVDERILYEAHHYWDLDHDSTYELSFTEQLERLTSLRLTIEKAGVAGLVGAAVPWTVLPRSIRPRGRPCRPYHSGMRFESVHPRTRALVLSAVLLGLAAGDAVAAPGLPDRKADPVVLTGQAVPGLRGKAPDEIVGFRWTGKKWRQVPIQVDERALVDYRAVRQSPGAGAFSQLAYTDAGTHAGSDPNPTLDADDEIAAMARDAGERAGRREPAPRGVKGGSRAVVEVTDPLRPKAKRYLYLYRSKGRLDPAAGKSYVDYRFRLESGDYKSTYDFGGVANNGNGPPANPENSIVTTPFYSQHLLSRWIEDELRISAGGASGVDILDGDKAQVAYQCGRSELTFSRGGGGFIANVSGPVRAIRSYIGANSGTFTQRDHVYYDRADVTTTYLRVHPGISTISQFYDYSPAAAGMTYRNSLNPSGVTIDGVPETIAEGELRWEQVSGAQGSASIVSRVDTDLPGFAPGSYYLDDSTSPPVLQCGGYADMLAYGSSGPVITSSGANTDPTLGPASYLTGTRTTFYGGPREDVGVARLRSRQVDAPLEIRAKR